MKGRLRPIHIAAVGLFLVACLLGAYTQRAEPELPLPRAQWKDASPLGGKGLRLLLGRLGHPVERVDTRLNAIPAGAQVWLLLDPETHFSRREAEQLLTWVAHGGTLLWAASPAAPGFSWRGEAAGDASAAYLREKLGVTPGDSWSYLLDTEEPLPPLSPLNPGAASVYWTGVNKATSSNGQFHVKRPYLELAGTPVGTQLARIDYGSGRVFVAPDALLFTNYALHQVDNAVLVTNLLEAHAQPRPGAVFFDERQHGEAVITKIEPSLPYYLWRPPLRYAVLQLLAACLLLWACYGRRLGTPVPLPETEPVTRASHFAIAMGALFQKAQRPRAAGLIVGEEFRRALTQRTGMSLSHSDLEVAQRAADQTGLPAEMINRLLIRARAPADHEMDVLSDTQEMDYVLRRLGHH